MTHWRGGGVGRECILMNISLPVHSFSILLPVSYHSIRQVGQFSVQPNPQQSVFAGHEQLQQSNSK